MRADIWDLIGTGNMGGAVARAVRKHLDGERLLLANRTASKAEALAQELGCRTVDNETVAETANFIFLGVKPQMMAALLAELGPVLARRTNRFILVTMAAGLTIARIQELSGGNYPVIRIMPNTPAAIGEGHGALYLQRGCLPRRGTGLSGSYVRSGPALGTFGVTYGRRQRRCRLWPRLCGSFH